MLGPALPADEALFLLLLLSIIHALLEVIHAPRPSHLRETRCSPLCVTVHRQGVQNTDMWFTSKCVCRLSAMTLASSFQPSSHAGLTRSAYVCSRSQLQRTRQSTYKETTRTVFSPPTDEALLSRRPSSTEIPLLGRALLHRRSMVCKTGGRSQTKTTR